MYLMPDQAQTPKPEVAANPVAATPETDTLVSACLLAGVGGLLDAVVYTLHGHVFANAMTGNVILLGLSAVSGAWVQVARHAVPIGAFLFGVAASRVLRVMPRYRAAMAVLLLEMVALSGAGLLPRGFPEMAFTAIIAFVSAFQVSTFRQVGRFSYNSTFITGNLREMAEGLVNHFLDPDADVRRRELAKSRKLAAICGCFLAGALLGAWGGPHLGNRTLWIAEPLLLGTAARVLLALRAGRT
jgi:uncharacterized membrane protein YoaK (UPF0700 family)